MAVECEAKIKVADLAPILKRLRESEAVDQGEVFERNWVLDRPNGRLRDNEILLRIRNTGGPGGVLTVKSRLQDGEFKRREEVETVVDSTDALLNQLATVGFEVMWIYEKRRWTWLLYNCVIALDDLPEIGLFVEIEGMPEDIRRAAEALGLDPGDHLCDNYLGLWQAHLDRCGDGDRHMIFPECECGNDKEDFDV